MVNSVLANGGNGALLRNSSLSNILPPRSDGSVSNNSRGSLVLQSGYSGRARVYRCPPRDRPLYSVQGYTITIHASDAHSSFWPHTNDPNDPYIVSWHQPVDYNDPVYIAWNARLAKSLAKSLDLGDTSQEWTLSDLPEGYRMFRRHDRDRPEDTGQNYSFMAGSSFTGDKRRFRTSKELAKHFTWLCRYGDNAAVRCECKHCGIIYADRTKPLGAEIIRVMKKDGSTPKKRVLKLSDLRVLQLEDLGRVSDPEPNLGDVLFGRELSPGSPAPVPSKPVASTSQTMPASDLSTYRRKSVTRTVVEESYVSNGEEVHRKSETTRESVEEAIGINYYMAALANRKGKGREIAPFQELLLAHPIEVPKPPSPPAKRKAPRKSRQAEDEEESDYEANRSKKRRRSRTAEPAAREESSAEADAQPQAQGKRRSTRPRAEITDYYALPKHLMDLERPAPDSSEEPAESKKKKDKSESNDRGYIHKERTSEIALACKVPGSPYRIAEVVWAILEKPFYDTLDETLAITHWPAVVRHRELKIESKVYWPEADNASDLGSGEQDLQPQLHVKQSHIYTLEYLGISGSRFTSERRKMLPYMAYSPSARLISDEQRKRLKISMEDPKFEDMRDLEGALTAFAYAHQLSKHVWSKYSVFGVISDPINKRKKSKSDSDSSVGPIARAKKMEPVQRTIQFYQCVWWGAEKIWAGELVRLAATWYSDAKEAALLKLVNDSKIVPIPGAKISLDSLDKPVLFSLAHIYRDPIKKRLRIMGTFLEILEDEANEDTPRGHGDNRPMLLDKEGRDSKTLPRFLPSLKPGRGFKRLRGVPAGEEFEFDATLLAGRYYDYDTLYSAHHDSSVRKNIKTLSGKATKKQAAYTTCRPGSWQGTRSVTLRRSAEQAREDMDRVGQLDEAERLDNDDVIVLDEGSSRML